MHHSVALLLLAAVAGYWVLERAETHKGNLKTLGQWLGAAILAVSLIGVGCKIYFITSGKHALHGKPWGQWHGSIEAPAPEGK